MNKIKIKFCITTSNSKTRTFNELISFYKTYKKKKSFSVYVLKSKLK